MTAPAKWRDRIVGEGWEDPTQLLANAANWRIHPRAQQDVLEKVLDLVGWVQRVIVNKRTGNMVDGHIRCQLAISRNEPQVPVIYIDVDDAEEALLLASLDPIASMAATDREKLNALLGNIRSDDARVQTVLDGVRAAALDLREPGRVRANPGASGSGGASSGDDPEPVASGAATLGTGQRIRLEQIGLTLRVATAWGWKAGELALPAEYAWALLRQYELSTGATATRGPAPRLRKAAKTGRKPAPKKPLTA